MTLGEAARAVGGRLLHPACANEIASGIGTDTRKLEKGFLFVPLKGPSFDGHDYIPRAFELGAACALAEKGRAPATGPMPIMPIIEVGCARKALLGLAAFHLARIKPIVVAVTGSAGKTTVKDMVAAILSEKYRTKKTIGNYNNDIGLPLSVFALEEGDEAVVLEMGMNRPGEIAPLSLAAKPDVAVVTNIGWAHIENFDSQEGILLEKLGIFAGLSAGGRGVLWGDDPLLAGPVASAKTAGLSVLYPSVKNIKAIKPRGLSGSGCHFEWRGESVRVEVPAPGAHMAHNALMAVAACMELGLSAEEAARGFAGFSPASGRLAVTRAGGRTVIGDAYNSSPDALRHALDVLAGEPGRRVAILGDMLELGKFAEARHMEAGWHAAKAGIDLLVAVGEHAGHMAQGYRDAGGAEALHFATREAFFEAKGALAERGDVFLVKASRAMKFEEITETLI